MSQYGYSSKASKSAKNSKSSTPRPLESKILVWMIGLFLVWAPYQVALFNGLTWSFDKPIFTAVLMTSVIALVSIPFLRKALKEVNTKTILVALSILIPGSYLLSLTTAVSSSSATNMVLITSTYFIFYTISAYLFEDKRVNTIMQWIIIGTAYSIVAFGLLHWLNSTKWLSVILGWFIPIGPDGKFNEAVLPTVDGQRLTSVFQYANTYAAYLMAFLFTALFMTGVARRWWEKALHSFMLVPIILSIFLTLSRSGLVLLPVVFVILLVFLKPHRQLMWILHLAVSGMVTLIIMNPVTELGLAVQETFSFSQSFKGWAFILIGSAISAAISYALERWVSPWLEAKFSGLTSKKWGNFLFPIGGMILGGLLLFVFTGTSAKNVLPDSIQARLETINLNQHSVLERITFYKDSAKVIADYPLIGAGGGAWAAMYEEYQNNPYTSRQAHSFYMQYLVEVGIIGFLIFAIFLFTIFYQYIRTFIRATQEERDSYFPYFIIAVSILVHSVMDFNMSFVYIAILVFICLGAMTASIDHKPLKKIKWQPKTLRTSLSIFIGLLAVVLLFTSITFISATNGYKQATTNLQTSNDYNVITAPLDKALSIRPHHPDYVSLKANLLTQIYKQTQDESYYDASYTLLQEALKYEPNSMNLYVQLINLYSTKNMEKEILSVYEQNLHRYPWNIKWIEGYMRSASRLAYMSVGDQAEVDKYSAVVMDMLKYVEDGMEYLKTLPEGQLQGRVFEITPKVALHVGQIYYLNGKTQEAYDFMKPRLQEQLINLEDTSDMSNIELHRWYIAMSEILGARDQAAYDKLIAFNPEEAKEIEKIINTPIK
ncbi:O-antigen ligase family protein [Paenibacillus marinisediminis]